MQQHLIKSVMDFQILLYSNFRKMTSQLQETLLLLSTGHLFGLSNPNQVADALSIPKAGLYRHLKDFSLYQWKRLLVRIGCTIALAEIRDTESKSASTQSRRCPTISVDDTNDPHHGKLLSLCYNWWSKVRNTSIKCRNVLGITIKIGDMIIPLNIRIVSKQGRGNTDKPSLFVSMLKEVLDFFYVIEIVTNPLNCRNIKNRYTCVQNNGRVINHIFAHTGQVGHSVHLCCFSF